MNSIVCCQTLFAALQLLHQLTLLTIVGVGVVMALSEGRKEMKGSNHLGQPN